MAPDRKLDLYKEHEAEYITPNKAVLLRVKPAKYLAISGRGSPGSPAFQEKIGALYNVAYTLKMAKKFAGQDYKVCQLEGLYWHGEESEDFSSVAPEEWNWRLLIRVPDFIKSKDLQETVAKLREKGKAAEVAEVKLEKINEGQCVQMLHVGPYNRESETVKQMLEFAAGKGLSARGPHHEIYLSDPRRVPAERLRTILRLPVGPIQSRH
jgi:hypothetical protein